MSVTRMSTLFLRTLRDDPAGAEVRSHILLVRAGYVRRVAAGIYSWLPLGLKVLARVERIVREEMEAFGAQEVRLPALLPAEQYAVTGRLAEYGDLLFALKDRRGAHYVLGPTHEELFTQLVKDQCSSYRDLPLVLYQIQTKYRDEARPRSGLLRGREFVMKDSYSFDLDDAGLQVSYDKHRGAYSRAFARMGLHVQIVSAVSGAMGGSHSEEFLAPAEAGEDTYVACTACDYAANSEAVEVKVAELSSDAEPAPPMQEVHTPGSTTIEALVSHFAGAIGPAQTLKSLLVKIDDTVAAIGVPGDREVDLARLEAAFYPATVEVFTADDFAARPELIKGYLGPQGLRELGIPFYADTRVVPGSAWVAGANHEDHHVINAVSGRDFTVDRYLPVAMIAEGDPCPRCASALTVARAIEVGHIFQLGRKYTDAFTFDVTGAEGAPIRVTMGSYGLGVSRVVAAVAEQTSDESGLCWPTELAPFDVHLVAVGKGDEQLEAAERLAGDLAERGYEVLLDDRRLAPGVAFADADLLGIPTIVVVGRGLAQGEVELKDRATGARRQVRLADLPDALST
jgi:prolyl-tRNA synthetase